MKQRFNILISVFLLSTISIFGQDTVNLNDLDNAYMQEIRSENAALTNRINSSPQDFQKINKQVSQAVHKGNYQAALRLAFQLDSLYPGNADVKNFMGKMQAKLKDTGASIASFDEAIRLDPTNKWFYINKAGAEADNGQKEPALQTIEELILLFPKWSIGYNYKAALLHALGKDQEALAAYSTALESHPKSALIATNRGDLQLYLKDTEKALNDYKKALVIQPDYGRAKSKIATISK